MNVGVIAWYSQGALPGRRLQSAIDEAMEDIAADDPELSRLGLSKEELLQGSLLIQLRMWLEDQRKADKVLSFS
jgi:hypothetical protein